MTEPGARVRRVDSGRLFAIRSGPFQTHFQSMADHFEQKHPSTPMPEELAKAVALKHHEKDTTLELLKVYS